MRRGRGRVTIPPDLLPADGRFGSGPSKVRPAQVDALAAVGRTLLGTSHRQAPVRALVGRVRAGLAELFALPEGYEVVLGNGGSTAFWDVATFGLVERTAQLCAFGEFGATFATAVDAHRSSPSRTCGPPSPAPWSARARGRRRHLRLAAERDVDGGHGARAPPEAAQVTPWCSSTRPRRAGGLPVDVTETDVYYFAPQKSFASDGGLWLALLSPAAVERAERIAAERWAPRSLSLAVALATARADQTLNTPAIATLVLLAEQVEWMLAHGGLAWATARTAQSAAHLYGWAEQRDWATPFVADPAARSSVVGTIDLDGVDAAAVARVLRRHGVVDVEPYRRLGRNQLRVAMFPAVDPADVQALTACVDHVVERLV